MSVAKRAQQHSALIAVGILAVLAVWLWFDLKQPVKEPGENPKVADLAGIQPGDVVRLEVKKGGKSLVAAREGGPWKLVEPVQGAADSDEVKRLVDGLLDRQTDFLMEQAPKDLKPFGLDKPSLEVSLTAKSGDRRTLLVGGQDPGKTSYYVRDAATGRIFLASTSDVNAVKDKDAAGLRDRTLASVPESEIERIRLEKPAGAVVVARKGADWELVSPWQAPADSGAVTSLASRLASLKADRFVEAGGAGSPKYGLNVPRLRVVVTRRNGSEAVFRVGAKAKDLAQVYAARADSSDVLALQEGTLTSLDKTASDLRSKRLFDLATDQAERVAVSGPKGAWEARREGGAWKQVKPAAGKPAKAQTVDDVLFEITGTASKHVAEKPASLARYGLDNPVLTVTVTLKGGAVKQLLVGRPASGDERFVKTGDSPAVFTLSKFAFDRLNAAPSALKE